MFQLGFNLGTFFKNLAAKAKEWGHLFIVFLGVILVIWGIVAIVKGFISHGRGQVNWLMSIAMILVGGFLVTLGSWDALNNWLQIGTGTLTELGH